MTTITLTAQIPDAALRFLRTCFITSSFKQHYALCEFVLERNLQTLDTRHQVFQEKSYSAKGMYLCCEKKHLLFSFDKLGVLLLFFVGNSRSRFTLSELIKMFLFKLFSARVPRLQAISYDSF